MMTARIFCKSPVRRMGLSPWLAAPGQTLSKLAYGEPGYNIMATANSQYRSAKMWDDLRIEPVARTTGTGAPTFEKWIDDAGGTSNGVFLYSFTNEAVAGNEKQLFFTMQLPHAWANTEVRLHVHWIPADAQNAAEPRFGLEYTWADLGATFPDTLIVYSTGFVPSENLVAFRHYLSTFAAISPSATQDDLSSVLIGRIFRNSSDAGDTYDDKIGILYIDAHIEINSVGSMGEFTK
jgi:hypothetical protein